MDNILLTHQIGSQIIDIIRESKEWCFLVTPYFQPWTLLEREFEKASKDGKKIMFIFRAEELGDNTYADYLNTQYGFDVAYVPKLHMKLYMNERKILISSMNLYDYSKENNYEIGYVINNGYYAKKLKSDVIESDLLKDNNVRILTGNSSSTSKKSDNNNSQTSENKTSFSFFKDPRENSFKGYCIRCGRAKISSNIDKALCPDCYSVWSQFKNIDYEEYFCHFCGNRSEGITYRHPLCLSCSLKYPNEF